MSSDPTTPSHDLRTVLDRLADGVLSLDPDWRVGYANEGAASLLRCDPETLHGASLEAVAPTLCESGLETAVRAAAAGGEPVTFGTTLGDTGTHVSVRVHPSADGLTVTLHPEPTTERTVVEHATPDDATNGDHGVDVGELSAPGDLGPPTEPVEGEETVLVPGEELGELHERTRDLERDRSRLDSELEGILERVSDAFFALDRDWEFTYVNEQAADLIGHTVEELEGEVIWDVYPEAVGTTFESAYRQAMTEQETVSFVEHYPPLEAWFEVNAYPSMTGLSVYFDDVTKRKERERDLELYETIVETVEDGIYALDEDGRFVFVNQGFCDLTGYDSEELLGEHVTTVKEEAVVEQAASMADAIAEGETSSMSLDLELHRADGDVVPCETRLRPFETAGGRGRCGVVRDISMRRARERDLERYQTIVETMDDGVYIVDDGVFTMVNEAYTEMVGYPAEELLGSHVSEVVSADVVERAREVEAELQREGATTSAVEATLERPDGSTVEAEAHFVLIGSDGGERLGVVRDITERKERERELERGLRQQRLIAELEREALEGADVDDLLDEATFSVAKMLETDYCEVFELVDDGAVGETLRLRSGTGWPDDRLGTATVGTDPDSWLGHTLTDPEPVVVTDLAEEDRFDPSGLFEAADVASGVTFAIGPPTDPWGVIGIQDATAREFDPLDVAFLQNVSYALETAINRWEYERELQRYEVFTEESTDVNAILDPDGTVQYVTPSVEWTLGYQPENVEGNSILEFVHPEDHPTIEDALRSLVESPTATAHVEVRFQHKEGEVRVVEATGRNLLEDPHIGGLVIYTRDVTERKERERVLREQRDQLAAVAQLSEVVREINTALIESSSREELERQVCERLVDAEPYVFAWVSELDTAGAEFVPRTSAGPHEDYLEQVAIPYTEGPDCGPTCRAYRTGEMQVTHVRDDTGYEAWRADAADHGFRSSAAIPVVHDDRRFGVLNVYSNRENAFDDQEGAVLSTLGEMLGHAIASLERKTALVTDTVTELDLAFGEVTDLVDTPSGDDDRTITVERTVDAGDGVYVVYLSSTGFTEEEIRELFGREGGLLGVRRLDDADDDEREGAYEVRVRDPPLLGTALSYGGSLEGMTFRDERLEVRFELALDHSVREFVAAVNEHYPDASLLRQKRVQREGRSQVEYVSRVAELLTDRQYDTLETAYFAGYYEWPRRSSASEVAKALSVSDATISQHFRSGHRKLCQVLFER
jgi:PAS domain S-box-containing protein